MSSRNRARQLGGGTRRWNEATVTSPGAKRATSGLFDGAKVTIAGRPVRTGARANDYTNDELAALVAYFMRFNAQPSPEHGGALVYRGSIASALRALFDSEPPEQLKKQVSYALNRNGFRSIQNGRGPEGFVGWRVGDLGTWVTAADVPDDERTEGGPVKSGWLCSHKGCTAPGPFGSRDELRNHTLGHAREGRKAPWSCPEPGCRFVGTLGAKGSHSRLHHTSPLQQALLDAVREQPGQHPRQYAEQLGSTNSAISALARQLREHGLMSKTGNTEATRYWPGATPPELVTKLLDGKPARTVVHTQERRDGGPGNAHLPMNTSPPKGAASPAVSATTVTLVPLADGSKAVLLDGKLYRLVELS